jgi:adenosylcobinamide-GDP ribazoletransferase
MRTGDVGPFGVLTLVLVLIVQVTAAAAAGPLGLLAAVTVGRVAMTVACRRGVPAARADGLGARVASSVPPSVAALLVLAAILGSVALGPLGPVGVLAAIVVGELLTRRCVRRLGGVTGDVLGAVCEVAVAMALVVFAAGQ